VAPNSPVRNTLREVAMKCSPLLGYTRYSI
jgi:hypothetical protein